MERPVVVDYRPDRPKAASGATMPRGGAEVRQRGRSRAEVAQTAETLAQFDRRERRYVVPADGSSPEEAVKAALKSWRNPERFSLAAQEETATGRSLPLRTCFALDVASLARRLPEPHRTIVRLYFMTARPPHPRGLSEDEDNRCETCQAHYGNAQIARHFRWFDDRDRPDSRRVGQFKRQAVSRIAVTIFPEWYRGKKARAGV